MSFTLGMAQMLVESGRPEANLARAEELVRTAAARGCQMVVLPECMDVGWAHPQAAELAEPINGPRARWLRLLAQELEVYILAGFTERDGDRVYNAALLVDPAGAPLLRHRKINLLVGVEDVYNVGDRLGVAHTPLGTLGVSICADNFPESLALGHCLARMGARVLLAPCAWATPADHDNTTRPYGDIWDQAFRELARLYDLTIVGVSNVGRIGAGPWAGRKCIGCSLAVGPGGRTVARGPYGEEAQELIVIEVNPVAQPAHGTDIAPMLRARGYAGP